MSFFSSLSLRAKLLTSVVTIVLIGFAFTLGVMSMQAGTMQRDSALLYAQELAGRNASQVQGTLEEAMVTARSLGHVLGSMSAAGSADRTAADTLIKGLLAGNPHFLGVWTGWEPNAFDGKDGEFVGAPGHDQTGRYVPYWNRGAGTLNVEPLVDYDKPGVGDYYQLAKQSGNEVLIEPYVYPVAGKDTLITTVTVPIMVNGKFAGVAGVDIALHDLQAMVGKIKVFDVGHASLLSNTGLYVGDIDPANVGKEMEKGGVFDTARAAIKEGRAFQAELQDPQLGDVTHVYAPVKVGKITTPWSFRAEVPTAKIMESVNHMRLTALALGLLSIAVVSGVLAVALQRLVLNPIGGDPLDAAAIAARVASGDLAQPIRTRTGDQRSLMAQLKHMQESLADVVSHVRNGAQGVATASAEISQGNQDLSSRTESQAAALEETSASMDQLGTTVKQNADSARQANQLAQNASRVAVEGGAVVGRVVETMKDINDSSHRIADIIGVIDGIAFQTNILALNAAVEAARAGEQGRGFAVVAAEVRSLAQRSAAAAKEIKDLIHTSVERVGMGTQLVDQAGTTMSEVVGAIQRVTDIMGEISSASSEQAMGVQHIGDAVTQMDQVTQRNAALVEEMAAAAGSLKGQADELVNAVAVFRLQGDNTSLGLPYNDRSH